MLLGVFCVGLVLLSGMVQAAHFHVSGQPDHDCALCLTAHSIAQMARPMVLQMSSAAVARLAVRRARRLPRRAVILRLTSRPPPALLESL